MTLTPLDAAMSSATQKAVNDAVSLRFGTVLAVNLTAKTVDVDLGDTPVKNVPMMEGSSPKVGGTAWLLYQGSLLVCIGPGQISSGGGGGGGGDGGAGVPVGSVQAYAGTALPADWLWCDGGIYSTTTYPALFAAIGYAYGGMRTSFNVPDLRDRSVVGAGASISLGEAGGKTTINTVVAHTHAMSGSISVSAGAAMAITGQALSEYSGQSTGQNHGHALNTGTLSHNHTVSLTTSSNGNHDHDSRINNPSNFNRNSNSNGANVSGSNTGNRTAAGGEHTHTASGTTAAAQSWGSAPQTHVNGAHWHSLSGQTSAHSHTATHDLAAVATGEASTNIRNPYLGLNHMIKAA